MSSKDDMKDANAIILIGYLEDFAPVDEFGAGVTVMTTDDIISQLSGMADIDQADANKIIVSLGFVPGRNDAGSFGWLMKPVGS